MKKVFYILVFALLAGLYIARSQQAARFSYINNRLLSEVMAAQKLIDMLDYGSPAEIDSARMQYELIAFTDCIDTNETDLQIFWRIYIAPIFKNFVF